MPRTLKGYREEAGLLFPASDLKIARIIRKSLDHIDLASKHCRRHDVVVQAGGNCGLWPRKLSTIFKAVYTFEPDPVNFGALAVNTADLPHVIKFQAALGDEPAFVELSRTGTNCGAHFIEGKGLLPTMQLDDLQLPACDLIYLDVEGFELAAFKGARQTIEAFRPVVGFEDKGLSERYGVPQGAVAKWFETEFGYVIAEQVRKDTIMAPWR